MSNIIPCELCGKPSELDFNCYILQHQVMVRGYVCLDCMGAHATDLEVVAKILRKRIENRKLERPVRDRAIIERLALPDNMITSEPKPLPEVNLPQVGP